MGILVDSEIDLSTRNGNTRVFIRENMDPLFDCVTAVGIDIERNYFFFYVPF